MHPGIKKLSTRLLVILVFFATGVTLMLLWVVPRSRTVSTVGVLKASDESKNKQVAVPDGWKKLDIKNRVTMRLPQDMQPSELIGDSFAYREAYRNRSIDVSISYGEVKPLPPNQRTDLFDPCNTPQSLLKESTYHESVIHIDGRKAKLSINRYYEPEFILARVCFLNPTARSEQLVVLAYCKDEHALETAQQIFNSIKFKDGK